MKSFRSIKKLTTILLFAIFAVSVSGQYRVDSWTTENGLPQNSVNGLIQASDGYIWGATFGGIFRFDGVRFKVFDQSNTEGLNESRFEITRQDKDGRLWFFSETRSIVKYENGQFTTLTKGIDYQGTPQGFFGGKDRPLIISTEKGHFRYEDGKFVKFEIATSNVDSTILHIDRDGGMWLADKGIHARRVKDGKVEYFNFPNAINNTADVNAIADDQYGNYWLSFREFGTFRIRNGKVELVDKEFFTLKLSIDSNGNLWIYKIGKLYKINAENLDDEKIDLTNVEVFSKETYLPDSYIQFVLNNPKIGLWAGTNNGGLLHIAPKRFVSFREKIGGTKIK